MPQPGMPSASGEDWLVRKVQDMERELRELKAANVFGLTGIRPKDGGTDFEGYVNINGPATVNGDSVFNGAMSILGALTLKPGIIQNDALANPLTTGSAGFTASNQAFTTTAANYGMQTIPVPAGFTQALVMNGVSAGGTNSTASGDYIYVSSYISGAPGGETPTYAAAGYYASASAFGISALSGLTGGSTVTVGVKVRTGSGTWAAAGPNIVNVNALALFYR